jgi:hypothetical protein
MEEFRDKDTHFMVMELPRVLEKYLDRAMETPKRMKRRRFGAKRFSEEKQTTDET